MNKVLVLPETGMKGDLVQPDLRGLTAGRDLGREDDRVRLVPGREPPLEVVLWVATEVVLADLPAETGQVLGRRVRGTVAETEVK